MRDFKKIMKKAGKTLLFFLILTGLLAGISWEMTEMAKRDDGLVQDRNRALVKLQSEAEDTIDVLFLGDSLGYTSFSPLQIWEEQGFTSYAGCQPGQKINETYAMLATAFEKQNPRLVVMETNTIFRDSGDFFGVQQRITEEMISYFPVFRFHNIWKPLLLGPKYGEMTYKGFAIRSAIAPYKGKDYMAKNDKKREISEGIKMYMERIIDLCREHDAELILVSAPSPVNYNDQKHRALAKYAEEKQLKYVDLNLELERLGIDWTSDTMDAGDHPNLTGAAKISRYIGSYLKENYNLPDHREDEAYSAWNKEAEEYREKILYEEKKMSVVNQSVAENEPICYDRGGIRQMNAVPDDNKERTRYENRNWKRSFRIGDESGDHRSFKRKRA